MLEFSFKYRNNTSQDLRSSFKYLKKLVKDRKTVICCADKDGKLLVLDFKDYNLIMEREFANQFKEMTHVDLTTVHHELQQIKYKCDNFLKNLHKAGAIDDSMSFQVTGLKEREQKYHKCSGNSTKYFSDLVTAYACPLFKTHKLDQESLLFANITNIPVRLLQSAGHITTSRFTVFLEHLLQPVSVEFC